MKTDDINRMIDEMIDNRKKTVNMLLGKALDQAVPETWSYLTSDQIEKVAEKFADLLIEEVVRRVRDRKEIAIENGWQVDETMSALEADIEDIVYYHLEDL